jgi:hypothetical protein
MRSPEESTHLYIFEQQVLITLPIEGLQSKLNEAKAICAKFATINQVVIKAPDEALDGQIEVLFYLTVQDDCYDESDESYAEENFRFDLDKALSEVTGFLQFVS